MLYHHALYFPAQILDKLPKGVINLTFSQHALSAARNDRYGIIPVCDTLDLSKCRVIEYDDEQGKVLYRTKYNHYLDICIVIIHRNDGTNFVKTIWLNLAADLHSTLDCSKYACVA